MKNIICSVFAVCVLMSAYVKAQSQNISCMVDNPDFFKDTTAQLKLFTGKSVEGKTYLHWNVANQHTDGIYLIYRSLDGKNYSLIGKKAGTGVPVSLDIAYYFTDEFTWDQAVYYKLLHIGKDQAYIFSDAISVICEAKNVFSATK